MQNSSASLLGLPSELRLKIYDLVCQQQLDVRPSNGFKLERHYPPHPNGLQGSYVKVIHVRTRHACFAIPWLDLTLSCKALSQEIKEHMESLSYLNIDASRTLEMDLKPASQGECVSLVDVVWRKLPCPAQDVRRLIVHNYGAATTIMTALNIFLHCGISMDPRRPLTQHLDLGELMVNVLSSHALAIPEQTPGFDPVDEQARSKLEFEHTYAALSNYHQMGKLAGYIRNIRVCGGDQYGEITVVKPFKAGYNSFRWGLSEVHQ